MGYSIPSSWLIPKMLMFTLAISCLTMFNLPWFMDLTFQVLVQYCFLHHFTFTPDRSITEHSFALVQLLHSFWTWKSLSLVWFFATPWAIQSMEFSRPEYWSGWLFPSPGDLPNPGIKPRSPALQVDSLSSEPAGNPSIPERVNKCDVPLSLSLGMHLQG